VSPPIGTKKLKESCAGATEANVVLSQMELKAKDNYRCITEMEPQRGEIRLNTYRQKTSTETKVPLLDCALQLVAKYNCHPKCTGQIFPLVTIRKQILI
jgi:hypothetical protein